MPISMPRPSVLARSSSLLGVLCVMLSATLLSCHRGDELGFRTGSPADNLPEWITPLLDVGLRPDWSGDSARLVYLDKLVGDVHELEIETGESRILTGHFEHAGFTRARYLESGDLLLCGPGEDSTEEASDKEEGGRWQAELWFLPREGGGPAQRLDEPCFEGPAVSRLDMQIAWTRSTYPDEILFARSEIWTGRIQVEEGAARLVDRRMRVSRRDFQYLAFLETQDFRPLDENELLFTAYAYKGGEVMGIDLESGEIVNYSRDWAYDEAEGVFPDGKSAAIERELNTFHANPSGDIDIWQLPLDGSGLSRRLTFFTEYKGFGASNPVVSPDSRKMAFTLRVKGGGHGNGQGILLYDFEKAAR